MPLVDMRDMLDHAYQNNYAIGGFGLVSLDFLHAILSAAEYCRSPVIFNLSEPLFKHFGTQLILSSIEHAAHHAKVPVAIHFDHGQSYESIVQAIKLGCNSVMLDASKDTFLANATQTTRVTEMAHGCGVAVEGALGFVGGSEGENAISHLGEIIFTSAEEAEAYVTRTHVDFLAVSIGTSHGRQPSRARLDFKRLKRIDETLKIPLVLHGGSGLVEEQYHKLILSGIAKINCYTELSDLAAHQIQANLNAQSYNGYIEAMTGVHDRLFERIKQYMQFWGSAGRAAEVLIQCRHWNSVEQIILFNPNQPQNIDLLSAQGSALLNKIPSVRNVFLGKAITEPTRYQLCWHIQLSHEDALPHYLAHPSYTAFINQCCYTLSSERINITFTPSHFAKNHELQHIDRL